MVEELSICLIGIGFFLWLFRGKLTWLAVLIPSVLWAFAHTSYVTSPIYARGVELTIVAVFLSIVFLKFNLLTTIMAHFTYNMMITGIVLLRSSDKSTNYQDGSSSFSWSCRSCRVFIWRYAGGWAKHYRSRRAWSSHLSKLQTWKNFPRCL